ncbi:MAG: hypothetical protein OEP95_10750 [Myxococcales bacterium]|nr:hypothetical protein [Myxococcales bacterium]
MPSPVLLTGADCFLRAFDGEVRRYSGASHLSQLVLRLGPGFDPEALRKLLAEVASEIPIVRAPIGRPGGVGAPVYRLDRAPAAPLPRVEVHPEPKGAGDAVRSIPEVFFHRLNDTFAMRRGELLRFDVVPYRGGAEGTDLAMTWLHMLFDGSGSEAFVAWLAARASGEPVELPGAGGMGDLTPPTMGAGRGREAQRWQRHMQGLAGRTPRSLAGPLTKVRQDLRYEVESWTEAETDAISKRASELAGFLTPMLFYLAASIRAHHAVLRARGVDPGSFVVPLPVNLRPKGGEGGIFRSHVSMLWFQAAPEDTASLEGLIEVLKVQRREAIKGKLIEAGVAAMDYARYAPAPLYAWRARRSFGGELCSFFFAYTAEFLPGLETFCGAPIEDGFHAPSVPASPGSSLIFSVQGGRLHRTHVSQQGVLTPEENALLTRQLRADLFGAAGG